MVLRWMPKEDRNATEPIKRMSSDAMLRNSDVLIPCSTSLRRSL